MPTIHHVFEIAAPCETVFAALTTPEGLSSWWTTRVSGGEAAIGSEITFTFRGPHNPRMHVAALDRPTRVVWQGVGGHQAWGDTSIRFELTPTDDGTLVRFWHELGNEADDAVGSATFTWGYYLDSLRQFCETGTGKPYQVGVAGARVGASGRR